ncbi:MAG: energy transducer TonB [Flavobacterium sp.]|nr:energy transducer TonB [Flavobacterium sp.]
MKNIILLLAVFSSINLQSQEYSDLFEKMDSISEKSINSYVMRILKMCNFEYNKLDANLVYDEREIIANFELDSLGKFKIKRINNENIGIANDINIWLLKAPAIPLDLLKLKDDSNIITVKFDLFKKVYDSNDFNEIIAVNNDNAEMNKLNELDIYPSYGKNPNDYDSKEKSLNNLHQNITKFITKSFKYPKFALQNNIEGLVKIFFVINKEGKIRTIICSNSRPILQQEAMRIITEFPKFNPGKIDNRPVNVIYSLPLNFRLQ